MPTAKDTHRPVNSAVSSEARWVDDRKEELLAAGNRILAIGIRV
jgi:hypothetical protein